jgi:hypothetical protein
MAFFYPPPPLPPSSSVTPPTPHEPQGSTGDQPPRLQVGATIAMVAVLAWPASLEPRLHQQNTQQNKIAPLTLPGGDQPPTRQVENARGLAFTLASWPLDLEPRLQVPNNEQQKIGSLPQGPTVNPPPPQQVTQIIATQLAQGAWPRDLEPRLQAPNAQQNKIVPLTLVYGDRPAPTAFYSPTELAAITGTWPRDNPFVAGPPHNAAVLPPPPLPTPPLFKRLPDYLYTTSQDVPTVLVVPTFVMDQQGVDQPTTVGPLSDTNLSTALTVWLPPPPLPVGSPFSSSVLPPAPPQPVPYVRPFMGRVEIGWMPPVASTDASLACQHIGLPAHDEFLVNYGNSLGPCNWTQTAGQFGTNGFGATFPAAGGLTLAYWKETALSPDQYAQCTIVQYGGDTPGPIVRCSPSGDASYAMVANQAASEVDLYQTVGGVGTLIQAATGVTLTDGDVLKLQVVGPLLRMFVNGVQIGTDQFDGGVPNGQPGIFVNDVAAPSLIGFFLADNVTSQVPSLPAGWLNPGIFASAFPPVDVQVVDALVLIAGENPDQPPIQGATNPTDQTIQRAWPTDWSAQTGARIVTVIPPVITTVPVVGPITPTELVINQAWPRDWTEPQRLTMRPQPVGGTPPRPHGPLSIAHQSAISQWVQAWPAQHAPNITNSLPTGQPPPPTKALSVANFTTAMVLWQPAWPAQFVKPVQDISEVHPFKPEWAVNSNQLVGPWAPQPETH